MKTTWLERGENRNPEQLFKLKFGSDNNNWVSVELGGDVDTGALHDGVYLAENAEGKYEIAEAGAKVAYPMLEMKYQYDNLALQAVTISEGTVNAFTKHFDGTPEVGDMMKIGTTAGKLDVLGETDDAELALAEVVGVYDDYIEIKKLY